MKGSYDLMVRSRSKWITNLQKSAVIGIVVVEINDLVSYMISQVHMIKEPYDFVSPHGKSPPCQLGRHLGIVV